MIAMRRPALGQRPTSLKLHIQELGLRGFSPADCRRIAEHMQQELARLVSESLALLALRQSMTVEQVEGGTFSVDAPSNPKTMASQIAHAIYEGIQRGIGAPTGFPATRPNATAGDRTQ